MVVLRPPVPSPSLLQFVPIMKQLLAHLRGGGAEKRFVPFPALPEGTVRASFFLAFICFRESCKTIEIGQLPGEMAHARHARQARRARGPPFCISQFLRWLYRLRQFAAHKALPSCCSRQTTVAASRSCASLSLGSHAGTCSAYTAAADVARAHSASTCLSHMLQGYLQYTYSLWSSSNFSAHFCT